VEDVLDIEKKWKLRMLYISHAIFATCSTYLVPGNNATVMQLTIDNTTVMQFTICSLQCQACLLAEHHSMTLGLSS